MNERFRHAQHVYDNQLPPEPQPVRCDRCGDFFTPGEDGNENFCDSCIDDRPSTDDCEADNFHSRYDYE